MEQALVFASIIIGVAISDQVTSLHRLLRSGVPVKWHWAQPWFAFLVLMLNVMIWWGIASTAQGAMTIGEFLPILVQLILLALLTISTLPDDVGPQGVDLADYYQRNRRYQWTLLAMALAWGLAVQAIEAIADGQSIFAFIADRLGDFGVVAVMIALAFVRRWWLVAIGLALLMAGPISWLSRTIG